MSKDGFELAQDLVLERNTCHVFMDPNDAAKRLKNDIPIDTTIHVDVCRVNNEDFAFNTPRTIITSVRCLSDGRYQIEYVRQDNLGDVYISQMVFPENAVINFYATFKG